MVVQFQFWGDDIKMSMVILPFGHIPYGSAIVNEAKPKIDFNLNNDLAKVDKSNSAIVIMT